MDDYKNGLLAAGFEHVEIVDSGADLNAYAKVENQAGCCSPAMETTSPLQIVEAPCCIPAPVESSLHDDLTALLSQHDVNAAAASVKVYAIKPHTRESKACCGPTCCA
jgi:arsenite methyltransferase